MNVKKVSHSFIPIYMGYYRGFYKPIAISNEKKLVKEYLESHRSISPKDYKIKKVIESKEKILLDYGDQMIEEYEGHYLPSIDIEMIQKEDVNIKDEIDHIIEGLKNILLYSQDSKKVNKDEKIKLLDTLMILSSFKSRKKLLSQLEYNRRISNSILYMKIEEYLSHLQYYQLMKESEKSYYYNLYKDD